MIPIKAKYHENCPTHKSHRQTYYCIKEDQFYCDFCSNKHKNHQILNEAQIKTIVSKKRILNKMKQEKIELQAILKEGVKFIEDEIHIKRLIKKAQKDSYKESVKEANISINIAEKLMLLVDMELEEIYESVKLNEEEIKKEKKVIFQQEAVISQNLMIWKEKLIEKIKGSIGPGIHQYFARSDLEKQGFKMQWNSADSILTEEKLQAINNLASSTSLICLSVTHEDNPDKLNLLGIAKAESALKPNKDGHLIENASSYWFYKNSQNTHPSDYPWVKDSRYCFGFANSSQVPLAFSFDPKAITPLKFSIVVEVPCQNSENQYSVCPFSNTGLFSQNSACKCCDCHDSHWNYEIFLKQ